jgi:hypothetical protein
MFTHGAKKRRAEPWYAGGERTPAAGTPKAAV